MAPSKTFNLAGLSTSSMIIPDPVLMEKYRKTLVGLHLHLGNIFRKCGLGGSLHARP
ncbi:MAG: hypothetical protein MZV63_51715 [Marinilabiliales bacterium]|nr:hypothetical protein [Marinilabiliales bacterium]